MVHQHFCHILPIRAMGRVLNIIVATSLSQGTVMLLSGCCHFITVVDLCLIVVVVVVVVVVAFVVVVVVHFY